MEKDILEIPFKSGNDETKYLKIHSSSKSSLFFVTDEEEVNGEAPYQIVEGKNYDYEIDKDFYLLRDSLGIVSPNKFKNSVGTISPNIYVGTLNLYIYNKEKSEKCADIKLEVRSVKTDYRTDYRKMLSDITEQCIDLIFKISSPVTQIVDIDYNKDYKTWHQRFAFVKSILDTDEFYESVNKIISSPSAKWKESEAFRDIRNAKGFNSKSLRQIAGSTNRINIPQYHPLRSAGLKSIPSKIKFSLKEETVDTPENRFIKYALRSFLVFITEFLSLLNDESKTKLEAKKIQTQLEQILGHSLFKEISEPASIILNSPVLQRKEGYREILRIWLMFGLAAKLNWKGGEDVYDIEKRDVATLYEYWLFFELLKIIENVFGIIPDDKLIVSTIDKLNLQLKQGKTYHIDGTCEKYSRPLHVRFSYNRTFPGHNQETNYPHGGSWTRSMRPDYTLSIWPKDISEKTAEEEELIVHVHFDAKYRIENILESLGEVNLDEEKIEQSKGTYKRADLLKMHSYKDAIRRTGGAYVLYPGKDSITYKKRGFRELIPGLGAFQIRPSESNDTGGKELEKFFEDIVQHFMNRTSQREKTAFRIYDIHKGEPAEYKNINKPLPETIDANRGLLPDETFVLIGFYKSPEHLDWINGNKLYNIRTGDKNNPLYLNLKITDAKYLLIHSNNETTTGRLYKLKDKGPRIYSKKDLLSKRYPDPNNDYYLIYEIGDAPEKEFSGLKWDITKLSNYTGGRGSAHAFSSSLAELMTVVVK